MFVDRHKELAFLNGLLTRKRPGPAQMLLMYGRRRVGRSELLLRWAEQSGVDYVYWEAVKENANQQRAHFYGKLLNIPASAAPVYRSWTELWDAAAPQLLESRKILILDELPYAADADPAMLSALQNAWDQHFQKSETVIALCGSHVHVMEALFSKQSPLFGRITAQWHLDPLPFSSLAEFFPKWDASERVAMYAMVGGIPAYLNWLDPDLDLIGNIRGIIMSPGSTFMAEPAFLLYDEVREPASYLSILKAIGSGAHTLTEISKRAFLPSTSVNFYLQTWRFGNRFAFTYPPSLAQVVSALSEWEDVTAFVEVKRASLRRFGRETVLRQVAQALKPVIDRCVVISFDLPSLRAVRPMTGARIGWVISAYDDGARWRKPRLRSPTSCLRTWSAFRKDSRRCGPDPGTGRSTK